MVEVRRMADHTGLACFKAFRLLSRMLAEHALLDGTGCLFICVLNRYEKK
jgi:hypothetical protein